MFRTTKLELTILKQGLFYQDVNTTKPIMFEVNLKLIIFQNLQPIAVITKVDAFNYAQINIIFVCFKKRLPKC